MDNGSNYVACIKAGTTERSSCHFYDLKKGDTFFMGGSPCIVGEDAHYSGDASYDGYLLYDENDNGVFPEDPDED